MQQLKIGKEAIIYLESINKYKSGMYKLIIGNSAIKISNIAIKYR